MNVNGYESRPPVPLTWMMTLMLTTPSTTRAASNSQLPLSESLCTQRKLTVTLSSAYVGPSNDVVCDATPEKVTEG